MVNGRSARPARVDPALAASPCADGLARLNQLCRIRGRTAPGGINACRNANDQAAMSGDDFEESSSPTYLACLEDHTEAKST
jgi:hypothetical protein